MGKAMSVSSSSRLVSAVGALAFVALAAGCDDRTAERVTEPAPSFRALADNGWELNSAEFNGWELNGWELNGVTLVGSGFTGTRIVDGEPVLMTALDFIGTRIVIGNPERMTTLRIDNIYPNPALPDGDVLFYDISVLDPDTGVWGSLCHDGQGAPTSAIPLPGSWNKKTGARRPTTTGSVTLACRGAALAKCVEWGYRPWATASVCVEGECSQVSLADHHQACTRMVRADYCGDGTPNTLNGTPIDVIDQLSPQIQAEGTLGRASWSVEAEWGPDGARCVGDSLRLHMFEDHQIPHETPACLEALQAEDCGSMTGDRGANLFKKFCSAWSSDPAA